MDGGVSDDGEREDGVDDILEDAKEFYRRATDHSAAWRKEAREDYDFVAGRQWSDEESAILREQMRPAVVFNRIGPVLDAVSGSEVSNRQEVRYIPREIGDTQVNEVLTSAAQWVRDGCDAEDEESDAFVDLSVCGMGWTETALDYESDPDGTIIVRRVDPLEMYWDPTATRRNLSDAQAVMRIREMDREEAQEINPDAEIEGAGPWDGDDDERGDVRERPTPQTAYTGATGQQDRECKIKVVHYQWFDRVTVYQVVDPFSGRSVELPEEKYRVAEPRLKAMGLTAQAYRRTKRVYREAVIAGGTVLSSGPCLCPDGFTFRAMTGKRDRNKNTWYGLVRAMKDPQRWANKWLSQVMHIINSNSKGGLLAEKTAFADIREAEKTWADPTAITWVNTGAISQGQIKEKAQAQYPSGIAELMTFAVSSIRDVTGVNLEMLGLADRQQAGVLEAQRKQAGLTILATLFDSLRRYRKEQGRVLLHLIQEYISDGRLIRIVGKDREQYVPLIRQPGLAEFDVVVDDAPTSPNQKEQVFATLMQLVPAMKGAGMPLPPEMIDYLPLPSTLTASMKQAMAKAAQGNPLAQAKGQADIAETQASAEEKKSAAVLNMSRAGAAQDQQRAAALANQQFIPPAMPGV